MLKLTQMVYLPEGKGKVYADHHNRYLQDGGSKQLDGWPKKLKDEWIHQKTFNTLGLKMEMNI